MGRRDTATNGLRAGQIRGRGKEGGLRVRLGLLEWPQGALPGHVVALSTLLASESVKLGGRESKLARPGRLSRGRGDAYLVGPLDASSA